MGDRAEHGRLDRVAPSERLRLEHLALEQLAIDRHREQRRERREEPLHDAAVSAGPGARCRERADRAPVNLEREGDSVGKGRRRIAESDPRVRDAEDARGARRDPVELVGHGAAAEQRRCDRREERCLALALLRLRARAVVREPRARSSRRRRRGTGTSTSQFSPSVRWKVCVGGRKSQLKASMLATATGSGIGKPPADGDRQHREHVERAEAENRRPVVEDADRRAETSATAPALASDADDDVVAAVPPPGDHPASVAARAGSTALPQGGRTGKPASRGGFRMEPRGLEPLTFWLPARRSPS